MAFGAGVLISAVAYELVQEAYETSAGSGGVALGLAVGSLAFFAGDLAIDRTQRPRPLSRRPPPAERIEGDRVRRLRRRALGDPDDAP